jgi:hypothetical protein
MKMTISLMSQSCWNVVLIYLNIVSGRHIQADLTLLLDTGFLSNH